MADRYISEKALIENIAKIEDLRTLSTKTVGIAISATPTADVVEVKHGEWIVPSDEIKIFKDKYVICSECNVMMPEIQEIDRYYFCPNCGAKMDGGKTE